MIWGLETALRPLRLLLVEMAGLGMNYCVIGSERSSAIGYVAAPGEQAEVVSFAMAMPWNPYPGQGIRLAPYLEAGVIPEEPLAMGQMPSVLGSWKKEEVAVMAYSSPNQPGKDQVVVGFAED